MQKLLFFSRVALICNICFLVTILLRFMPFLDNGAVSSTLIISGSVLSIIINSLLVLTYILLTVIRRPLRHYVPGWLVITNFLIFVLQVIFLI